MYQVALKSCGGTKGDTYKTLVETNVDYLFIFDADKEMFLIPCVDIKNKATLNLSDKYLKYKIEM